MGSDNLEVIERSPESVQAKVDAYFDQLGDTPPTKPDIALWLGFHSVDHMRSRFNSRKDGDADAAAYKKAMTRIEAFYARNVAQKNAVGSMFMLKASHGYRDNSDLNKGANAPQTTVALQLGTVEGADEGSTERPKVGKKKLGMVGG